MATGLGAKVKRYINGNKIKKGLIEGRLFQRTRNTFFKLLGKVLNRFEEKIDFALGRFARKIVFRNVPIDPKLIVFCSFQGDYTDNPKYITEELIRRHLDCRIIWIARKKSATNRESFPLEVAEVYEWYTLEAYEALCRAKVLVVNSVELFKRPYPKKEGQYIIETWHGSLGIKRFDRDTNGGKAWVKAADLTTKICDYLVSNSAFETRIYRDTFWPTQEVWEVGHPRNDCLINITSEQKKLARRRLFQFAGIQDNNEKLFLYAPTFRDSKSFEPYNLNSEAMCLALKKKFGGEWLALYRYHPTVRAMAGNHKSSASFIIDLTAYPDMQDLLQVADVGITDYSSWIYDFMLTGRPGFIFATDIADYNTERGFAYPLETTPFPIATNNYNMVQNILSFDMESYKEELSSFLKEKGCIENGHASETVTDKILELMECSPLEMSQDISFEQLLCQLREESN